MIAAAQISANSIKSVVCALHAHVSKMCCKKKKQKRQKRGVCGCVSVPGAYACEIMSLDVPLWIMMMPNEPPAKSKQRTRSPCRPARQGDPGPNAPPLGQLSGEPRGHPSQRQIHTGPRANRHQTQTEPKPPPSIGRACGPRTQQTQDPPWPRRRELTSSLLRRQHFLKKKSNGTKWEHKS